MFDPFLEELNISIRNHGGSLLEIPKEFREYFSSSKKVKIRSWLWDVPGFRRWRVTRLDAGEDLQVLNSVAYPEFKREQPILGIDLLWFEKRKRLVAVLDFQPLVQDEIYLDKYFSDLQKLKNSFTQFNNQKNMFVYDSNIYFSPWVLFCKGGIKEAKEFLPPIFTSFLNSYWRIQIPSNNASDQLTKKEVEKLQINYDKYSADRDPAHSLFSGFFGKNWSDKFLKEFLFPLSQK